MYLQNMFGFVGMFSGHFGGKRAAPSVCPCSLLAVFLEAVDFSTAIFLFLIIPVFVFFLSLSSRIMVFNIVEPHH